MVRYEITIGKRGVKVSPVYRPQGRCRACGRFLGPALPGVTHCVRCSGADEPRDVDHRENYR